MHARPRLLKKFFGRRKKNETDGEFDRGRNCQTSPDTSEDSVKAQSEIPISVLAVVMPPPPTVQYIRGDCLQESTDDEKQVELQHAAPDLHLSSENGHEMSSNYPFVFADGDASVGSDRNSRGDSSAGRRGSLLSESEAPEREMYEDAPSVVKAYDAIPVLEQLKLPRGGVSMETKAVGRVQFGIPPETIKDSMRMGIPVPQVYIVPVERFCREMGPALGVNLAEFEFPAYFNFFVYKKRCTLIVDSEDAEDNIRRVFSETLLGPAQFRREENPIPFEEEDFDPDFPRDMIPNFQKELKHFRIMPDGKELVLETLLNFCHFETPGESGVHDSLGIPRSLRESDADEELTDHALGDGNHDVSEEKLHDEEDEGEAVPKDLKGVEKLEKTAPWTYSQARFVGDVATVWPPNATEEQKRNRSVPRVEIFKMPGGTEYILHDIDEHNYIVGKARFSGHVKVSESMSVDGFGGRSMLDDFDAEASVELDDSQNSEQLIQRLIKAPPTFHPPSFGVTVLGNSHGFDKSGSVSGYVLWINGRGVMIDPPPYSSATLEKEGIRPRTIVGIILTHCHADHDAGAFQKVLTGSPVVVITTPTIYKSFIRKYAALSALSPALLRHSHRHKPAIIGRPLRFQGATFHFTYTLHTIPCLGFRVDWRGRSMVFTGDHFNSPPALDMLQDSGVLSKARADDLRNLPLQETDLLLHEAGAPPIHTPLEVLKQLPPRVKKRLYVVHTSALPEDCELRVAPTGTAGTIRLDQLQKQPLQIDRSLHSRTRSSLEDDQLFSSPWSSASNEYESPINEDSISITDIGMSDPRSTDPRMMQTSFAHLALATPTNATGRRLRANSLMAGGDSSMPLVSLRPASSTDAWFILNLLSAVPFLTSLSYASTMEVLETARVDAYCMNDVIVPAARRSQVLCVVWEGTCLEREKKGARRSSRVYFGSLLPINETDLMSSAGAVWHAGDWTGPIALQPERRLSGENEFSETHDIVAMSSEGVKVITVEFSDLHAILKSGSPLYRKYIGRTVEQQRISNESSEPITSVTEQLLTDALKNLNVLELLDCNSALRKLSAVQKRHLECLAEGPISFGPGERLWRSGAPVDRAFLIVSGTASFVPKRRNAGSVGLPPGSMGNTKRFELSPPGTKSAKVSLGESMRLDAIKAIRELGVGKRGEMFEEDSTVASEDVERGSGKHSSDMIQLDSLFSRTGGDGAASSSSITDAHDYAKLSRGLQKRAELIGKSGGHVTIDVDTQEMSDVEDDEYSAGELETMDKRAMMARRRSSRARFANKVLGRLYNRRAFTGGLVFSRGHFLGDVSKMVHGVLSSDSDPELQDDASVKYGFGDDHERTSSMYGGSGGENLSEIVIHEQDDHVQIVHTSTLTAGKDGCVALVFPKANLIPFLDEYPGLLLSLLGTQVVV